MIRYLEGAEIALEALTDLYNSVEWLVYTRDAEEMAGLLPEITQRALGQLADWGVSYQKKAAPGELTFHTLAEDHSRYERAPQEA